MTDPVFALEPDIPRNVRMQRSGCLAEMERLRTLTQGQRAAADTA